MIIVLSDTNCCSTSLPYVASNGLEHFENTIIQRRENKQKLFVSYVLFTLNNVFTQAGVTSRSVKTPFLLGTTSLPLMWSIEASDKNNSQLCSEKKTHMERETLSIKERPSKQMEVTQ